MCIEWQNYVCLNIYLFVASGKSSLHFSSAERKATHVMNDVGEFAAVGDEEDAIKTGS